MSLSGEPSHTSFSISEFLRSRARLQQRLDIERVVADISSDLVDATMDTLDAKLLRALKDIGTHAGVDRSYIFRFRENGSIMENTHEWCADGIEAQIDNLQEIPTAVYRWWTEKMRRRETIHLLDVKRDLPREAEKEREVLEAQGIISLLVVTIAKEDELYGFMGFDAVRKAKHWDDTDIRLLEAVSNSIAGAFYSVDSRRALQEAMEQARESDRLKSAFLAMMSHELRTPLHHILGHSGVLRNRNPDPKVRDSAGEIFSSAKHLLDLIDEMLLLSSAEKNALNLKMQLLSLEDVFAYNARVLEELLESSGKDEGVRLHCSLEHAQPEQRFIADRNKINQVLQHLFRNAIAHASEGDITFIVRYQEHGHVEFVVSDTGPGIPPEKQESVFEPFHKGSVQADLKGTPGLGIGLALARRLALLMNGTLTLEPDNRNGATFRLSLPMEKASYSPLATTPSPEYGNIAADARDAVESDDEA
ncbi:MAG: GAF domain-containing sensor histidine kinase [Bacteroidota bacterium]|nr:GAF domain-containing sensor histidine kinase [Bacteroidota bacterium]